VAAAKLEARLYALPDSYRAGFRSWRKSQKYPPPREVTDPEVLGVMAATVDQLEVDAGADAETFGEDPW
jgi:hypothetical protein